MTPTDELKAAATSLRATATAAGGDTWQADHFPEGTIVRRAGSTQSLFRLAADGNRAAGTPYVLPAIGDQIATMNPGVGLALADWLEATVAEVTAAEGTEYALHTSGGMFAGWDAALAVARAILAGSRP